jgi:chemotaxis protein MotB
MAGGRSRRHSGDYGLFWPGYVDVLSTLLLVVTFLMSIFMLAQYFASQEASGKDTALKQLTLQISQLTNLLALEKGKSKSAEDDLAALQATLSSMREENAKLSGSALSGGEQAKAAEARITTLTTDLENQKNISNEALAKVDLLNQQLLSLRRQIAALNDALEASEKKDQDSQSRIKDLGARLNAALARQVQELQRYRSDFFGRLRELLKNRKDIRVVGDRFVFESEVLFPSGSNALTPEGLVAMDQLASAIIGLEKEIPKVLQVDSTPTSVRSPPRSFLPTGICRRRVPSRWSAISSVGASLRSGSSRPAMASSARWSRARTRRACSATAASSSS